jgi:antitoxin ParD1/3/4
MAHNTSVSLGDHFQQFTAHLVEEGRYSSVSEVVRAGMRLLEEHEQKVTVLRQAIKEGRESGFPGPFDPDAFLLKIQEKHGSEV